MQTARLVLTAFAVAVGTLACSTESPDHNSQSSATTREVRTTFYPTTYFAQRLLGDSIPVICALPADAEPTTWSPSRADVQALQAAQAVVVHGAGLEGWVERTSLSAKRTIETTREFRDRFLTYKAEVTHSHGPAGEHSHEGIDAHTWLDPLLATEELRALAQGLERSFKDLPLEFTQRRLDLEADLLALHERFEQELSSEAMGSVRLFAAQPVFHYLAARYGWELIDLNLSLTEAPGSDMVERLADPANSGRPIVCLWQAQASKAAQGSLALLGVRNVVFDPLESAPPEGDYLTAMNANLDRLVEAVRRP